MAYQHFYSRVPARISIFNRIDSFDTFAHSAELDRDFILGELSPIYADKLNKQDAGKIRRGEIPTVYSQIMRPSGRTVQSALTYLPLDYTGERSSYLVHSLVLTDEERSRVFANPAALSFNPKMFARDISGFRITAPNIAPNRALAGSEYSLRPVSSVSKVTSRYNPEMLARFIFAIVDSICGKGNRIYFRLPTDDKNASAEALELISAVMNILPYNMREQLSFVTFVSDSTHYPEFRVKCVSSGCRVLLGEGEVFFDFGASTVSGMGADLELNRPLVRFLYSLFDNATVRDAFHIYAARIFEAYPDRLPTLQLLNELVFMFWQCSGFYVEQSVLPNDNMIVEFFTVYEKYRDALTDDYRKRAYKCLERYAKANVAIPASIFAKLDALYPGESVPAKRVALEVVLDIIHTDVMRHKLFAFIRKNYSAETPEVKAIINDDLSRVFYGGFLQYEILTFFDSNFSSEPIETQNLILNKLLLSIRTPAVQDRIVTILDAHYISMTWDQKVKVYSTLLEMLPECDRLSSLTVWFINKHVDGERKELPDAITKQITEYLAEDYKREAHLLLPILTYAPGFCEDIVIGLVFTHWKDSVVNQEYVQLVNARSSYQKLKEVIHICRLVPNVSAESIKGFIVGASALLLDVQATLYDFLSADAEAKSILSAELYTLLCEKMIYPAVIYSFYDVFKVRYGKDGIQMLIKYVGENPALSESEQYMRVLKYTELTKRAEAEDTTGVFVCIGALPEDPKVRVDIANHIRMCSLNKNTQSEKTAIIYELCMNYLKTSKLRLDNVYTQYKSSVEEKMENDDDLDLDFEKLERAAAAEAVELIIGLATEISLAGEEYLFEICDDSSGFPSAIKSFILSYGLGVTKFIKPLIESAPFMMRSLVDRMVKEYRLKPADVVNQIIDKGKGIFKK